MHDGQQKECDAIDGKFNGKTATSKNGKQYTVKGWGIDSNGCILTYGEGYDQSFAQNTDYEE